MKAERKKNIIGKYREKAETILKKKLSDRPLTESEVDTIRLNHELQVHEIELELINEELIRAKELAEATAEKYSELYYAPMGYFTLSKKNEIIDVNPTGALMLGSEKEKLLDKPFSAFVSEESKFTFDLFINRIFKTKTIQTCDITLSIKEMSPCYIYMNGLINGSKSVCHLIAIDITDRKKAEKEYQRLLLELSVAQTRLLKLNEDLLRSNKDLENFAYIASHDLQEPLRMVSSFMQLLSMKYENQLDTDAKDYIGFAVDGAKRMYELLNGLLTYSRVTTKGIEFTKVDMSAVLKSVLKNLDLMIKDKKAVIKSEELPVIMADENQMVQLLQNLIANAIRFNLNTPEISISSQRDDQSFIFSIRDNGIGIEEQYFERIFKIFQRLAPRENSEGIGIGLSICKRIIERHKGKIWVESKPGGGSSFYFTIPKN